MSCDAEEVLQPHTGQAHPKYPQRVMEKPSGSSVSGVSHVAGVSFSASHLSDLVCIGNLLQYELFKQLTYVWLLLENKL